MIVLLLQGAVRARSSAFEPGRLTEVCIRNNQDSVARIPTQRPIEGAGIEAGDLVLPAVWIAQQRPAEAILQSHIAANLPGIPEVRLNVVPTSLGEGIGLELTEAPRPAGPKCVKDTVASFRVGVRGMVGTHAPELRVFGRGCIDQLILLVIADQKAHLESMNADDLGEVILQDCELLVVVPRGDVPYVVRVGPGPKAAPENGVTDLASGSFLRQGEKRFERPGDLISQPRVSPAPRNGDPVGGVGYLEIVHAGAAKQLGQLDGCLIPGLQPVALNAGVAIVAPKSQRAGEGLAPVVLRVAAHQTPGLADLVVRADAFFPPINGEIGR